MASGAFLLVFGGRLFNNGNAVVGGALLLGSLPLLIVGLGIILIAHMRWTNPTL